MRLTLSPTIRNEWQVRCIGDVVPALAEYCGQRQIDVDSAVVAAEIAADCRFQADPRCVDNSPATRRAYLGLLRQIEAGSPQPGAMHEHTQADP